MAKDVYVKRSRVRDVANGLNVFSMLGGSVGNVAMSPAMLGGSDGTPAINGDVDTDANFDSQGDSVFPMHSPMLNSLSPDAGSNRVWYQSSISPIGMDSRYEEIQWGHLRDDRLKRITETSRFAWLDKEVEFVGNWCLEYKRKYPDSKTSAIKKCRLALMTDDAYRELHGYFHVSHISSTERLTHGYKMYLRKHGLD